MTVQAVAGPVSMDHDDIQAMFRKVGDAQLEARIVAKMAKHLDDRMDRIERLVAIKDAKLLSVSDAALLVGKSRLTVRRWLEAGKLKGSKSGKHNQARWMIARQDLDRFLRTFNNGVL